MLNPNKFWKIVFFLFLIFFFCFSLNKIEASPMPPSPVCSIEAIVLESKYKLTYYEITLKVTKIFTHKLPEVDITGVKCNEIYVKSLRGVNYNSNDYKKIPLRKGDKISGLVHYSGDEFSSGTSLYNVKIIEPVKDVNIQPRNFLYFIFNKIKSFFQSNRKL